MQTLTSRHFVWVVLCVLLIHGVGCSEPGESVEQPTNTPDVGMNAPDVTPEQDIADASTPEDEVDPAPDLVTPPQDTGADTDPEDEPAPDLIDTPDAEDDAGDVVDVEPEPEVCEVASTPMRRLSHFEYRNTMRDLFPDATLPNLTLPADNRAHEFDNDAEAMVPSAALLEAYTRIARGLVADLGSDIVQMASCTLADQSDAEIQRCGRAFVTLQGQRLFRRPLSNEQIEAYTELMRADIPGASYQDRLGLTLQLLLSAPEFLYRMEHPAQPTEPGEKAPLDAWSRASRLSYFLWGSTPDEALLQAAQDGSLMTPEGMEEHALRLANDPRARDVFAHFHAQWLDYDRIDRVTKRQDDAFDDTLRQAMRDQAEIFVDQILFDERGDLADLLSSDVTFVNGALARLYNVEPPEEGWQRLAQPQRAGLLTQPLFLAGRAHPDKPSPVLRGTFVLERILCIDLGPPPPNAEAAAAGAEEELEGPLTNRQIYELVTANSPCNSCHEVINPIGAAFENYDTMGRYQTHEPSGLEIDSSASVLGFDFEDATELMGQMSESTMVERCVTSKWVRYAYAGGAAENSRCLVDQLRQEQREKGGSMRDLQISIATNPWFGTFLAPEDEPEDEP